MKLWVGCSGWQYDDWKGEFYPSDCPKTRWFDYYQKFFNTVEVNASYYRFPTDKMIARWVDSTSKDFRFTIKVHRAIVQRKMKDTESMLIDFYGLAERLGDRLGCLLFQFPKQVKYDPSLLERLASQLDPDKRNVVEFRHDSWWREEVRKFFRNHKFIFCSVSAPRLPESVFNTTGSAYVRFHGKKNWYNHSYSESELAKWVNCLKKKKIHEAWIYFNNDVNVHAPKDAVKLKRLFQRVYSCLGSKTL
jgi:uncharacterized protein YecE (DUF72 family)